MTLYFFPNLTLLYPQAPFLERFALAAADGFTSVEFQFPYESWLEAASSALQAHKLRVQLFNLPPGIREQGEFGTLSLPGRLDFFRASFEQALDWASVLGCPLLNLVFGNSAPNVDPQVQRATALANLMWALPQARAAGVTLLLEPLNRTDLPAAFLKTTSQALEIIRAVDDAHLRLQYDLYHSAMDGEDILAILQEHFGCIGHIQLADCPGRHEPGTGQVDFPAIFAILQQLGYAGWIGLDYNPSTPDHHPQDWMGRYA